MKQPAVVRDKPKSRIPWRGPAAGELANKIENPDCSATAAPPRHMQKNSLGHKLWLAVLVGLLVVLVGRRHEPGHGLTALIQFGADFAADQTPALADVPHHVREPHGFDAQFYAQIALDPLLLDPATAKAVDDPSYRGRRILMPWTAYLLGLGQPRFIIHVYPVIDLLVWLALLGCLLRWLAPIDAWKRGVITAILFSSGTLEALRLSLTDLPATLLMLVPCATLLPAGPASVWLALASLCRETSVLGVAAYFIGSKPTNTVWLRRIGWAGAALLPAALWMLSIHFRFGSAQVTGGNFATPLAGAWGALELAARRFAADFSPSALGAIAAIIGLHWQALHLWRHRQWQDPLWRLGVFFSLLLVLTGPKLWEVPLAACRAVLPMTIAFNLLLAREPHPRWALLIATNLYSVYGLYNFITYVS